MSERVRAVISHNVIDDPSQRVGDRVVVGTDTVRYQKGDVPASEPSHQPGHDEPQLPDIAITDARTLTARSGTLATRPTV